MALQRAAQRLRDALPRQVVFRGAKPAHKDDHVSAVQRDSRSGHEISMAIAHHGLEAYFHPQFIELAGEKERVRVLPVRCQQLRANGNDLSVHLSSLNERQAPDVPGKMENRIRGDQHCAGGMRKRQANQVVSGNHQAGLLLFGDSDNAALSRN